MLRNQGGVCIGLPCGLRFKDSRGNLTLVIYLRQTLYVVPGCHCPSRFTSSSVLPFVPNPPTNVRYALQYRFITLELMSTGEKKNLTYFVKANRIHNGMGGGEGDEQQD